MSKRNIYLVLGFILVLSFLAGNLSEPRYFNRGIDFLNQKLNWQLPHFWVLPFKLGLDLQGGTHLVYEADLSRIKEEERSFSMQGLRDVIERRVNLFGVSEPVVQVQEAKEHKRLIVELAGVMDPAQAIEEIGKTPFLEFKELKPEEEVGKIQEKQKEIEGKSIEEIEKIENWQLAFEDPFQPTSLTGRYLEKAELGFDQITYKPMILLQFSDEGAKIFENLTEKNVGNPLAIFIDDIPISSPIVQEKIAGGKAQITGTFTIEEARELARNLNAGALPVPIKLISQQTVGPTLGEVSLGKSLRAGITGFLAVILFMMIFYRFPGLLSAASLGIYIAFVLSLFKLIPVTLTLAGIGGFILSIGMAVDANVLIFSRIREELAQGKTFTTALGEGFKRAWPSIRDGNLTTLLVALIFFGFGTSFVKGFAFTLTIGILVSLFSAIFVTRTFLNCFEGTKLEKVRWLWK